MSDVLSDSWGERKAEIRFRQLAFSIAYYGAYRNVSDLVVRFGMALAASVRPIRDRSLLNEWWEYTKGCPLQCVLRKRRPPPRIKALVDAAEEARRMQAKDFGDEDQGED